MSKYIDKDRVLEYIIFGVVGKDITCGELTRAIESLPTIEVSEDCIDRKALLEQIDADSDGHPGQYGDEWHFIDTIKNAPRAVPIYQPITIKADEKDLEPLKKQLKNIKTTGTLMTVEEYGLFGCRFRTVEHTPSEDNKAYTYCSRCGMRVVVDAPSATTEQSSKVGEWIKYYEYCEELDRELWYGYTCSLCGRWEGNAEPYCNCGAKMKGADDVLEGDR